MIRDITIGQYYPANSVIHRLDPRVKLLGTIVFVVTVFFVNDLMGLALATVALAAVIGLSKVPLKYMLKGLKAIFILMIFTVLLNIFVIAIVVHPFSMRKATISQYESWLVVQF